MAAISRTFLSAASPTSIGNGGNAIFANPAISGGGGNDLLLGSSRQRHP